MCTLSLKTTMVTVRQRRWQRNMRRNRLATEDAFVSTSWRKGKAAPRWCCRDRRWLTNWEETVKAVLTVPLTLPLHASASPQGERSHVLPGKPHLRLLLSGLIRPNDLPSFILISIKEVPCKGKRVCREHH